MLHKESNDKARTLKAEAKALQPKTTAQKEKDKLKGMKYTDQVEHLKPGTGAEKEMMQAQQMESVWTPGSIPPSSAMLAQELATIDAFLNGQTMLPANDPKKDAKKEEKKGGGEDAKQKMTGIATDVAIGRFAGAVKTVEKDWAKLEKKERAEKMGKASNDELERVGVPKTAIVVKDLGTRNGQLDFVPWNVDLNEKPFDKKTPDSTEMAGMADTLYHESRHAEQWHRMARILAGQDKKGPEIAKATGIKAEVANDAAKKPLKGDSQEAKEGMKWHESVYGAKAKHRGTVLTNLGTHRKDLDKKLELTNGKERDYRAVEKKKDAKAEEKKAAFDAWTKAYQDYDASKKTFDKTYKQYRDLPEEADAWMVGGKVQEAYKKA